MDDIPVSSADHQTPDTERLPPAPVLRWLGRVPYEPTWRSMQELNRTRTADTRDEIWFLEHDPVFTLGLNGRREHVLAAGDIPVINTDRGGQVTYHGPGQLVVYPLLDLARYQFTVRELVLWLEKEYGFDRWDAYMMLSQCGKVRLGNFVDPKYTVATGIDKKYLA